MGAFLMANTYNEHNGTGSQDTFAYTFPYLKTTDVKVSVDGVVKQLTTDYTRPSVTTIQFNSDKKPAAGTKVRIYRDTDEATANSTFYPGSAIKSSDLNDNFLQAIYIGEEGKENADDAWNKLEDSIDSTETWVSDNTKIGTTGAVDARVDSKINTELTNGSKNFNTSGTLAAGATTVTGNITVSGTVDGRDVAADGTKLDGIESGAKDDQTAAEIKTLFQSSKLTKSEIADNEISESKLNVINSPTTGKFLQSQTGMSSGLFWADAYTTASDVKTALQSDKLTSSEIATGALDNRYYTETECDAKYFNVSTGDTIKDGDTFPDNDTTIATTAAINDRIVDLLDDVGGFVPIANETSFPNANPDVNNGTGTLISIKALSSNLTSNGSGVATIANGTVGNSTVTITGLDNSTTYAAPLGMIVETTTTLNTYAFHRQVPQGTDVSTVAGSISNVNTVASNISNVNTVAGNNTNITTVAGNNSNITAVAGNSSNINSAVANASNINSAVSNATNINSAVSNATNINTVAGISSNVTTVAGISSDVTAVANDATDIGAVAAKATEIGRLGTADAVSDLNTLGTTDIVSDLDTCATNVSNINNVGGSIANVNTVATNLTSINDFADKYRIASSAPGSNNDVGDLYYNTSDNKLYIYNSSAWDVATSLSNSGGTVTGDTTFTDSTNAVFGTGSDLKIYHNGSSNYIEATNGNTYLWGGGAQLKAVIDGAVELYHDGAKKLETHANGVHMSGSMYLPDNQIVGWGDVSNPDLRIYHDSSHSRIKDTGTGYLIINTDTGVLIKNGADDEGIAYFTPGGAVELMYDNGKKFETMSSGITVTGDIDIANGNVYLRDDYKLNCGLGNDLQIYHDGDHGYMNNNTGNLSISGALVGFMNAGNSEWTVKSVSNGAVELFHDGDLRLQTWADGINIHGDEGEAARLHLYADNGDNNADKWRIQALTDGAFSLQNYKAGSWETSLYSVGEGKTALYYDDSAKLETTSYGISTDGLFNFNGTGGKILLADDGEIQLGAGPDLRIYHDGNQSVIKDSSGKIQIFSEDIEIYDADAGYYIDMIADGAVNLYYAGSAKFSTTASGAKVTGKLGIGVDPASFFHLRTSTDHNLEFEESSGDLRISALNDARSANEVLQFAASEFNFLTGKVGIGTTSPADYHTHASNLVIHGTGDTGLTISAGTGNDGRIMFADGTTGTAESEGTIRYDHNDDSMHFSTSDEIALSLDINQNATFAGDVSIEADAGSLKLYAQSGYSECPCIIQNTGNNNSADFIHFKGWNGSIVGSISGYVNSTTYATSSDYRLKENEVAISDGITRLKTLKPYRFNFKTTPSETVDGFFAHEVTPAVPEAIVGEKDATENVLYVEGDEIPEGKSVGDVKETIPKHQGIDQSKLVPLLTAALQEAIAKIETLETKVAALEST